MASKEGIKLQHTAKHSAIYAFGAALRRLTGFVMLPIYTRYLTPTDYGVVELLTMAIELAGILIGLRITQAMFRFYILAEDEEETHRIVSTVLITIMLASSAGSVLLYASAGQLSALIFGDRQYTFEFQLFAFTLITNAITAVGLALVRARRKPVLFVTIGAATLALQVLMNIIFVVMLEMHVTGVVISAVISGAIVSFCLSAYVLSIAGFHFSTSWARQLISYVYPLIFASLGTFYVAYADKYFLRLFSGLEQVGLYALAARISTVLATLNQSFNMSWMADRFEIVKQDNARVLYQQVFRFFCSFLLITGAGLSIFANDFLWVMTIPEFYPAGNIVPFLVAAVIIQSMTLYCNFGIMLEKHTALIARASWYKAVLSTIGYLVLIKYIGVYGAAITLLLSNTFELYWINKRSNEFYDMQLQWGVIWAIAMVALSSGVAGVLLPSGEVFYFIVRVVLFATMLAVIYWLPIWTHEDKRIMKGVIVKIKKLVCLK